MTAQNHYTYRVVWSQEDQEFVGLCTEFPSLSYLDANRDAAFKGIGELVEGVVTDMQANGEALPVPYADRSYSGEFMTRVPGDLHRRLVIEAAEADISLNRLVSFKLSLPAAVGRPPADRKLGKRGRAGGEAAG